MKGRAFPALLLVAVSSIGAFAISNEVITVLVNRNPGKYLGPGSAFWKHNYLMNSRPWDVHVVHPTRGWTLKSNFHAGPPSCTLNDRGFRATTPYAYQPDKYTILVAGDSFTFGAVASDADVWPAIAQGMEPRFHVLNLGVSGYGADQMFITVSETIADYKPQLVIFAFLSDDLDRSMWSFRDYAKPKFVVSADGTLDLTNTPIPTEEQTFTDLKRHFGGPFGIFRLLWEARKEKAYWHRADYGAMTTRLNTRLFEETMRCSRAHGAASLFVHLANGIFLNNASAYDMGEDFLSKFAGSHDVACLETRKAFLDAHKKWFDGHYDRDEAELVAALIVKRIRELPSWKSYAKVHQETPPAKS